MKFLPSMTIDDCLTNATCTLKMTTGNPRLDAEVLLGFVLKKQRAYLYTWPEKTILDTHYNHFQRLIDRRLAGTPIAYITGQQEFWSLPFKVTSSVLIPRPETELLVETVLDILPKSTLNIVDLGTGSGAIAIALATERKQWNICAVEQSVDALSVASENAHSLGSRCISFLQGSWYEPLGKSRFHAIVSNPPYIETNDSYLAGLIHEPQSALTSGTDGLDDIRKIVQGATQHLHKDGHLILEHGHNQRERILNILSQSNFKPVAIVDDLAGIPRIIAAQLSN